MGSTYFVTTERYLDDERAICAAAESARHQVPGPPIGPPTVPVPPVGPPTVPGPPIGPGIPVGPVLSGVKLTKKVIHVSSARATPRATKLKLALNVAAKVVVTIKGTSTTSGKKVKAKLVLTLAAGESSVRLTGKVGAKRLPPGAYQVKVRATNAAGAASASAGRLKLRP